MCEYCNGLKDCPSDKAIFEDDIDLGAIGKEDVSGVIWQYKEKYILNIGLLRRDIEVDIKYCPMCGRKLGENENV